MLCETKNGGASCQNEATHYVAGLFVKTHLTCDECREKWALITPYSTWFKPLKPLEQPDA